MTAKTDARLAPSQRLARGLKYTAVGPVDITRGVVGLGAHTVSSTASGLQRRYEKSRLRDQLASVTELAEDFVADLVPDPVPAKRKRRPLLIAAVAAAVLAGGAVTFSIVRRSMRPEPSPLPPSVEVAPKP